MKNLTRLLKTIVNLLYHDSNGYGRLYVNYMRRGNKEQNTRYINRIKKILKIGGMYILGGLGLEHLYYNYDN